MSNTFYVPPTISGKTRTRSPQQADLTDPNRYTFLNVNNAEPNLGVPKDQGVGTIDAQGSRYVLLSNTIDGTTPWRVWSYLSPRIYIASVYNSIGIGDNANPIEQNSFVYSNYNQKFNTYNGNSLFPESVTFYSVSGIYLFNATTIGDPASATSFIVKENGYVGIGTSDPITDLHVVGTLSASDLKLGNASVQTFSTPVTASGDFIVLNINGKQRAIRLWDY